MIKFRELCESVSLWSACATKLHIIILYIIINLLCHVAYVKQLFILEPRTCFELSCISHVWIIFYKPGVEYLYIPRVDYLIYHVWIIFYKSGVDYLYIARADYLYIPCGLSYISHVWTIMFSHSHTIANPIENLRFTSIIMSMKWLIRIVNIEIGKTFQRGKIMIRNIKESAPWKKFSFVR